MLTLLWELWLKLCELVSFPCCTSWACRSRNFLPWRSIENCPTVFSAVAERYEDESDVATGVNYGVDSSSSWSKSICSLKTGITRIGCPWTTASSKGLVNTLDGLGLHLVSQEQAFRFSGGWLKISSWFDTPLHYPDLVTLVSMGLWKRKKERWLNVAVCIMLWLHFELV